MTLKPFAWKERPALIETLFPVQKLSVESYKEQEARQSKTLTPLGSYWKGRKPLILNKACILGCLLPTSDHLLKDLQVFELLMGMDPQSMAERLRATLPASRHPEVMEMLQTPYSHQVDKAKRPEEMPTTLFNHVWETVNAHLGTSAHSFPELVEQMGIARFGHRPQMADVFCGSGQIPFEAARLGCDVYASDLNPIACLLTWGAFHIVGASPQQRSQIVAAQQHLAEQVQAEVDALGIETDGAGWRAKAYLYCVEVICPESGWRVPLIPSLLISKGHSVIAKLVPIPTEKRYDIEICYVDSETAVQAASTGTVQNGHMVHSPDGVTAYRTSIASLRGDYREDGENKNRLRLWEKSDFVPRPDDIFQERLYCIQWMRPKTTRRSDEYQFRAITAEDLTREQKVITYVGEHLLEWQDKGYVPDMMIEAGDKTDEPIRTRGWTHWHHLFNPRQLLVNGLIKNYSQKFDFFSITQILNNNARLSRWNGQSGVGQTASVFDNQALNTLFNYGCRGFTFIKDFLMPQYKSFPLENFVNLKQASHPAFELKTVNDLYITDPPYGDAVKYEEITEFFIAWLRKNPPPEFAHWTWDSRRTLAIKGEDEGFRQGMIAAYSNMAHHMPDNGMQVLMFTHQSGTIWADMANIIWASGLQVTAAWYVVTETDSALRQGANVTGTIMLVLRKRHQHLETFRDELGWEIEAAVKAQVESLVGLDQSLRAQGSEGLYNDADLQMAGYAAALKVLTAYAVIDGKDMMLEAEAPRQTGAKSFVDEMIQFAVQTAVQFLVPSGFGRENWQKLRAVERFYLKMLEQEKQGLKSLDNYQNFAKAFQVKQFDVLMSDNSRANSARLKLASEFRGSHMAGESEWAQTPLRGLLYALYEIQSEVETDDVLLHLMQNCPQYLQQRPLLAKMAAYIAQQREGLKGSKNFHPEAEASAARILTEALKNQRL